METRASFYNEQIKGIKFNIWQIFHLSWGTCVYSGRRLYQYKEENFVI